MQNTLKVTSILLTLGISAAACWSADEDVSDLCIGAGFLSKGFSGGESYTVNEHNGSTNGSAVENPDAADATSNRRLEVSYMNGHLGEAGGFLWGVDAAVNKARFAAQGAEVIDSTPVLDLQLGYGYAPLPHWNFELTAFGGFGWTYSHLSGSGVSDHVNTHYLEYGARLATTYAIGNRLVLGIAVPYLVGDFHPSYSSTNSNGDTFTASDRERNRGFGVLGEIGIRL